MKAVDKTATATNFNLSAYARTLLLDGPSKYVVSDIRHAALDCNLRGLSKAETVTILEGLYVFKTMNLTRERFLRVIDEMYIPVKVFEGYVQSIKSGNEKQAYKKIAELAKKLYWQGTPLINALDLFSPLFKKFDLKDFKDELIKVISSAYIHCNAKQARKGVKYGD